MPFSRFLNAEETLQDLVLSLVAEMPAIPLVTNKKLHIYAVLNRLALFAATPLNHQFSLFFDMSRLQRR